MRKDAKTGTIVENYYERVKSKQERKTHLSLEMLWNKYREGLQRKRYMRVVHRSQEYIEDKNPTRKT